MMNKRNTIIFVTITIIVSLISANEYFIGMMWGVTFYILYLKSKELWQDSEKKKEEI